MYKIIEIEDEVEESLGNYFSINGSTSTQILRGSIATEYDDTIYAENLSTSINAGAGSDIISVISGSGTIDGGSGADQIYLGTTTVTIVGSGEISSIGNGTWKIGEDTISGIGSNYSIVGAGDGLYKITEIEDEVEESLGNYFSINGANSTQILRGSIATEYDDTIYAENLSTSINAGDGSDLTTVTIVGSGNVSQNGSIWTIGEDSIFGLVANDSIVNAGNNLFAIVSIGSTEESVQGSIIYGSINSIDDYLAPAVEDSLVGTGSVEGSTVAISWTNLGLAIETNEVHGSDVDIDQPNSVTINENGEMTAANSSDSDAVISVDANTNSATLIMNESNRSYNLTFHGGAIVANWNQVYRAEMINCILEI